MISDLGEFVAKIVEYWMIRDIIKPGVVDILYMYLNGNTNLKSPRDHHLWEQQIHSLDYEKVKVIFQKSKNKSELEWIYTNITDYIYYGHISDLKKFCEDYWDNKKMSFSSQCKQELFEDIITCGRLDMYHFCLSKGIISRDTRCVEFISCPNIKMINQLKLKVCIDFHEISYSDVQMLDFSDDYVKKNIVYDLPINPDLDMIKYVVMKLKLDKTKLHTNLYDNIPAYIWSNNG